ncbi:hypothetical protein C3E98_024050 [Pseudomonas sp. MWU13-2625]|nr:hypothetical protein C3E98_024050 [Pseudomonas sp. MWU13-2625]
MHSPCGSGLAREEAPSVTSLLNDTPPSRAGSLPQFDRISPAGMHSPLWERACSRRGPISHITAE